MANAGQIERVGIPRSDFQLLLDGEKVRWMYAALMNQPRVVLHDGKFLEPFNRLTYVAALAKDQLVLQTTGYRRKLQR